jgi:hypothetical protein
MKKFLLGGLLITMTSFLFGQKADNIINAKEVARIENVLAADEMRGRKTFSPEIDKAADFIAGEFKKAGLEPWKDKSYLQEFQVSSPVQTSLTATINGETVDPKNIVVVTSQPDLTVDQNSGFEIRQIKAGGNLYQEAAGIWAEKKNIIVAVDTSFSKNFPRLTFLKRNMFKGTTSVVFILSTVTPASYKIVAHHNLTLQSLKNVVGILPGKSKKDEYVIFSGHYDHIGVTSRPVNGDSINNGANDDAAGTTAVILLAKYFKQLKNNERTIVFAAFTAEEIGGYGSQYFSQQFDPEKVVAMFNIEMIGTESKWGKNSAYITGFDKTDMGAILQKNLEGTGFTFYPDPYPQEQLFYRSDNATLARLGVPAHTISTAKMDDEPHYHKVSDTPETLDMENMAMIIRSIALSSRSIVAGTETPSRVKKEDLR